MFDYIRSETIPAYADSAAPLREFADPHRDALLNAAELLGGGSGLRLATKALDGLASEAVVSRRTWNYFTVLLELLALEHVHDGDREEAAYFLAIAPCDPVVEEICELTDGLREALSRAATDHRPASRKATA